MPDMTTAPAITPATRNADLLDSALQRGWRFETILHIGGMTADDALPAALDEALDEDILDIAIALGVSDKAASSIERDELLERMRRRRQFGFLACVATPVRTYVASSDTYLASWGHYARHWLYAEQLADLLPAIESWVDARNEAARADAAGADTDEAVAQA